MKFLHASLKDWYHCKKKYRDNRRIISELVSESNEPYATPKSACWLAYEKIKGSFKLMKVKRRTLEPKEQAKVFLGKAEG